MSVTAQVNRGTAEPPKVHLDSIPAAAAVADIIAGDYCKKELATTRFLFLVSERKSEIQTDMIANLNAQVAKHEATEAVKDQQLTSKDEIVRAVKRQLTRQSAVSWLWKAAAMAATASTGYLLITKN